MGIGAEEQDDSVRGYKVSFFAGVWNFNNSLLATAGRGLLPIAVLAKGQRTKTFEQVGRWWQIKSLEGSESAEEQQEASLCLGRLMGKKC